VTELAHGCGFSTVRNFNRVFKLVTGYTPRTLPKEFIVDRGLRMSGQGFDPTDEQSVLIGGE
jgi:AraC-like DNA-binding protein